MRKALAVLALLALAGHPAFAQGKTKQPATPAAVEALEVCEAFARGDVMALDLANAAGWQSYADDSESPFVQAFSGDQELRGIGYATLFSLVESYPQHTFGYCRIDVAEPQGEGAAVIAALTALDRYEGETRQEEGGTFASLTSRNEPRSLLLTHWTANTFVIQLTIVTPKAEATGQ